MKHLAAAVPEQQGDAQRARGLHHGEQRRLVDVGALDGVAVGAVQVVELLEAPGLPVEELYDGHARNGFAEIGVDPGDAGAYQAVGLPRLDAEDVDAQQEKRDQRQRNQRHLQVERDHDAHDGDDEHEVGHQVHGPGGEHLLKHIHVRGHAGHDPSHGVAVEVAHGQALHVREQRDAHVGETPLRHQHGQVVLQEERPGFHQQRHPEQHAGRKQREAVAGADRVDAVLQQQGLGQVEALVHRQEQQRQEEHLPVRPQEPPETPGQLYVVGLAGDVFLLFRCVHRNHGATSRPARPTSAGDGTSARRPHRRGAACHGLRARRCGRPPAPGSRRLP